MLLTCPVQTPEFLTAHNLGVEAHIGRYDKLPGWEKYIPFVGGVHLPYSGLNFAALDENLRITSIETVKNAIDIGLQYPVDRMVMHITGTEVEKEQAVGDYDRLISSIRTLADYAASKKIILCLENAALHHPGRRAYGIFVNEWFAIHRDVDRSNVLLTLDTSHAATSAAMVCHRAEDRFAYMYEYLKKPELIGRVHWSDSRLQHAESYYNDMHLVPGEGDLPLDFHRKIKALDAVKTLEQRCEPERIAAGLEFIESL